MGATHGVQLEFRLTHSFEIVWALHKIHACGSGLGNHCILVEQVTTVREELEDYLKDDDDMAKMSLTRKREQALAWAAAQRARSPSARPKP